MEGLADVARADDRDAIAVVLALGHQGLGLGVARQLLRFLVEVATARLVTA